MIGIAYNKDNKQSMKNELSSLTYQGIEDIHLINSDFEDADILICDTSFDYRPYNKIMLIIKSIDDYVYINESIFFIQYESELIRDIMIQRHPGLSTIKSVIINRMPKQKKEIKPLDNQDSTIFFHGIDIVENMIDEMFELDRNTHYDVKFYPIDTKEIPSRKHKLSWNVTTDNDLKGYISNKILFEIENGCLPIVLKESMPKYFFAYPFAVSISDLQDKEKLIESVKRISAYIGKMTKEEFKELANAMYKSIYVKTNWKYNFYLIAKEIRDIS